MTIEYWIDEASLTGLAFQSIWVGLLDTETKEVRRFEAAFVSIEEDPETYIEAHFTATQMWADGTAIQIMNDSRERALLKAFVSLVLDEINILRNLHSLSPRTKQQLIDALKAKLGED